jgi:hypothetical protein
MQREMQADIKQEKNHTEFGKLLDGEEITAEASREGTDAIPAARSGMLLA